MGHRSGIGGDSREYRKNGIYGKTRAVISISADSSKEDAIAAGREAVKEKLTGNVVKEIYVPGKIVNIVMK